MPVLDKARKLQLIERSLGLKHKLKVNESGHSPLNHKEMASLTVANWDLEDEVKAIDEYLTAARQENVRQKILQLQEGESSSTSSKASKAKPAR